MAYMVEGYADVISMHQAGITNVVASSGTSLTEEQIKLISHFTKNLTLLYDGDPAGIKASLRGIDMVLAKDMNVRVVLLPDGQDPDDFARAHTTEEILAYLKANAVDFITFKTRLLLVEVGEDPIRRAELIENILTSISVVPDEIKRAVYIQECSRLLHIGEAELHHKLNRIFRGNFQKQVAKEMQVNDTVAPPAEPEEDQRVADARAYEKSLEREILRLLVNFGKENTTQPYVDAQGNTMEQVLSVCAFLVMELQQDELSLSDPLYQRLFSIFAEHLNRQTIPEAKDLLLSEEPDLHNLVADLASSRFEISPVWKEKNIYVRTVQNDRKKLDAAVSQTLLNFKLNRVKGMIAEVDGPIKEAESSGDEQLLVLLEQKTNLDKMKIEISRLLRRVIA